MLFDGLAWKFFDEPVRDFEDKQVYIKNKAAPPIGNSGFGF